VNPKTEKEKILPSRYSDHAIHPGDVVRLETPGGGGLGNPLERDPTMVRNDVRNGYVSKERAEELYGVVVEKTDGEYSVNEALTRKARRNTASSGQK